jgi:multimeric flavodoxin WrbA
VASPVYVHDVSGVTKNWIDRLGHVCHRPEFAGKCAYLLTTVGGSPTGHALKSLEVALSTWGFHITGKAGFKTGALMTGEQALHFRSKAGDIARRLFRSVERRGFARPSFRSLMTFKIQQNAWRKAEARDSVDYLYWKRQGWLEPGSDYYVAHDAGRLKVVLARLVGAILAPFVS